MTLLVNRSFVRLLKIADSATWSQKISTPIRCFASQSTQPKEEIVANKEEKDPFLKNEIRKFNLGKRWLARMMGGDPDNFTQKDIDEAIQYLLPSDLSAKDARPILKHPYDLFPKTKESRFDKHQRPLSSAFYTGKPKFYDLTYQVWQIMEKLESDVTTKQTQSDVTTKQTQSDVTTKQTQSTSERPKTMQWMKQFQLEQKLNEKLNEKLYQTLMFRLKKLAKHERAAEVQYFLQNFQVPVNIGGTEELKEVDLYDGVARAMGYRKTAIAEVILREGEGRIFVNNKNFLDYFFLRNDREQVMYPLLVTNSLSRFDIEANIIGGGTSGKSGAIRLGISRAIAALCPEHLDTLNEHRLLIRDFREKERKKPGKKKARRAFQWVKR